MGEAYWADFSFQINGGKSKKGFFSISRGVIFALIHFFGVLLARFFKKRNKKKKKEKRKKKKEKICLDRKGRSWMRNSGKNKK